MGAGRQGGMSMRTYHERAVRARITIRPATAADEPWIVGISNAAFPDYAGTVEELREDKARLHAAGGVIALGVAATPAGEIAGFWQFHHMLSQFDPTRYRVEVVVDPASRRRGVGGALFDDMLAALHRRGARVIESFARETMPDVGAFLERRGFRETMRTWECRLDLRRFDPTPFAPYLDRARRAGVAITTLENERRRAAGALRRAYELHTTVHADIPAPIPYTPPPFEHYVRWATEPPRALPDAYFIATLGEAYVGEANLRQPAEGTHLNHAITGVLPAHRGKGIAVALKLATIAYGLAGGRTEIRTWNEQDNAGILAINDRLGFVRQPAWLTFERTLATGERA